MNRRYIAPDDDGTVWLFEQTDPRGRTRHDIKLAAQDETDVDVWAGVVGQYGGRSA